ncbi:MAG: class I SAM-dependent methyltransferase [Nanoarchaeota archaeon]
MKDPSYFDRGVQCGHFGRDGRRFFYEETAHQIAGFCQVISASYEEGSSLLIGDVGGGNGLVAKELVKRLGSVFPKMNIHVLDCDAGKFECGNPWITFKEHDVRNPLLQQYDALVGRSFLHYNVIKDQECILNNMKEALRSGGIACLIQPCPLEEDIEKIQGVYNLIASMKSMPSRTWVVSTKLETMIRSVDFDIINHEVLGKGEYSIDGFYKVRYRLDDEEVFALKNLFQGKEGLFLPTHTYLLR